MKRLSALLICGFFVFLLNGCQDSAADRSGVEVIIDGDEGFPEFLVGRWKADKNGWEFVFEEDGAISSAVITLGKVRMKPGQVTTVPMKKGGKGIYEPGEWLVQYTAAERELIVKISLKNFHLELGENVIEGNSIDVFAGQVSEDGDYWPVEWTTFPRYTAHTAEHPNFKFYDDPNESSTKSLVFEKVKEE